MSMFRSWIICRWPAASLAVLSNREPAVLAASVERDGLRARDSLALALAFLVRPNDRQGRPPLVLPGIATPRVVHARLLGAVHARRLGPSPTSPAAEHRRDPIPYPRSARWRRRRRRRLVRGSRVVGIALLGAQTVIQFIRKRLPVCIRFFVPPLQLSFHVLPGRLSPRLEVVIICHVHTFRGSKGCCVRAPSSSYIFNAAARSAARYNKS